MDPVWVRRSICSFLIGVIMCGAIDHAFKIVRKETAKRSSVPLLKNVVVGNLAKQVDCVLTAIQEIDLSLRHLAKYGQNHDRTTGKNRGGFYRIYRLIISYVQRLSIGNTLTTRANSDVESWGFTSIVYDYFKSGLKAETDFRWIMFDFRSANPRPLIQLKGLSRKINTSDCCEGLGYSSINGPLRGLEGFIQNNQTDGAYNTGKESNPIKPFGNRDLPFPKFLLYFSPFFLAIGWWLSNQGIDRAIPVYAIGKWFIAVIGSAILFVFGLFTFF